MVIFDFFIFQVYHLCTSYDQLDAPCETFQAPLIALKMLFEIKEKRIFIKRCFYC